MAQWIMRECFFLLANVKNEKKKKKNMYCGVKKKKVQHMIMLNTKIL